MTPYRAANPSAAKRPRLTRSSALIVAVGG